jgi:hypothetical protein
MVHEQKTVSFRLFRREASMGTMLKTRKSIAGDPQIGLVERLLAQPLAQPGSQWQ